MPLPSPDELYKEFTTETTSDERYLLIARKIFLSHGLMQDNDSWGNFIHNLNHEQIKKLKRTSHFYYYICQPYSPTQRDDLRMIGVTSLIECLMEKEPHRDFFTWLEDNYPSESSTFDIEKVKAQYQKTFGLTRRIRLFFKKYITGDDKEKILAGFRQWDEEKNKFVRCAHLGDVANILYEMRSEFVHSAHMTSLNPEGSQFAGIIVNDKPLMIKIGMSKYLDIFERSFIRYWKRIS